MVESELQSKEAAKWCSARKKHTPAPAIADDVVTSKSKQKKSKSRSSSLGEHPDGGSGNDEADKQRSLLAAAVGKGVAEETMTSYLTLVCLLLNVMKEQRIKGGSSGSSGGRKGPEGPATPQAGPPPRAAAPRRDPPPGGPAPSRGRPRARARRY